MVDLLKMNYEEIRDRIPKLEVPGSARDPKLVEKKHAQIVDRACNVLFTNGFHKTSMRDIALACNMSIGQLYHYISSKDDILYLVHEHMQKIW
ncbi:MAG: TetR/AcrR family transcriptional regulator [Proteobacteria bacterium]|nr:TetR/AcrR family transcriptional regulator [Pseudomonadota bacterium]